MKKMATDSEATAEQMANDCKHFDRLYYRLNVEHGLEHIGLEEWETLGEVKTPTTAYLNQPHVSQEIDEIVAVLVGTHSPKYMLRQLGRQPNLLPFERFELRPQRCCETKPGTASNIRLPERR